jgi:hypothetical protein
MNRPIIVSEILTAVLNILLISECHKDINRVRKLVLVQKKSSLGFKILYYYELSFIWLGLVISSRSYMDIGMFSYTDINYPMEHSHEVWQIPAGTTCMYQ